MIKKVFTVFSLSEAVCGISNKGIDYDEHTFTLSPNYKGYFESEKEALEYMKNEMDDYKKRNVGEKTRFVIIPVWCFEDDVIFKK